MNKFTTGLCTLCLAAGVAVLIPSCEKKTTPDESKSGQELQTDTEKTDAENSTGGLDFSQLQKPATEAEIAEVFYWLPEPLAIVDGKEVSRKLILDDLMSQGIPIEIFQQIGEDHLREAVKNQVDSLIRDEVMLYLAAKAGYVPSAEFVANEMREELKSLNKSDRSDLDDRLKARGQTIDEYIVEVSGRQEIQKAAALSKFARTVFLEKAKAAVTDEEIQKLFDEKKDALGTPESVKVAHILVQVDEDADSDADKAAKEKIDEIYSQLVEDPEKFAELAREKSDCPSGKADDGKLPAFAKDGRIIDGSGGMDQTFATAAFTLEKEGQVSKPVRTSFGYHIIKLYERTAEEPAQLEKVKDQLIESIATQAAQEAVNEAIDKGMTEAKVEVKEFAPPKEKAVAPPATVE